jgi:hypothetical protein
MGVGGSVDGGWGWGGRECGWHHRQQTTHVMLCCQRAVISPADLNVLLFHCRGHG